MKSKKIAISLLVLASCMLSACGQSEQQSETTTTAFVTNTEVTAITQETSETQHTELVTIESQLIETTVAASDAQYLRGTSNTTVKDNDYGIAIFNYLPKYVNDLKGMPFISKTGWLKWLTGSRIKAVTSMQMVTDCEWVVEECDLTMLLADCDYYFSTAEGNKLKKEITAEMRNYVREFYNKQYKAQPVTEKEYWLCYNDNFYWRAGTSAEPDAVIDTVYVIVKEDKDTYLLTGELAYYLIYLVSANELDWTVENVIGEYYALYKDYVPDTARFSKRLNSYVW